MKKLAQVVFALGMTGLTLYGYQIHFGATWLLGAGAFIAFLVAID